MYGRVRAPARVGAAHANEEALAVLLEAARLAAGAALDMAPAGVQHLLVAATLIYQIYVSHRTCFNMERNLLELPIPQKRHYKRRV